MELINTEEGLTLSDGNLTMTGDFTHMIPRLKPNNLTSELIIKAAKIKGLENPSLFDATAGMGEDSLLLAAFGFTVDLYEQDEIIAALLEDTVKRSLEISALSDAVSRMKVHQGDSIAAMYHMVENPSLPRPDVILLDPMFPERQKSGLIKKKFQLLQQLERPCDNEDALFDAAAALHPKKIVVKRPAKGPYLSGRKPSFSQSGKAIRYDVYVNL